MRIGIVAPPWIPVPPIAYGGTEFAIDQLVRGLVADGHEVHLVAHPDSVTPARLHTLPISTDNVDMGQCAHELAWVLGAYDLLDDLGVDVIHDHTLAGSVVGRSLVTGPIVITNHGPFDHLTTQMFERAARTCEVVALTRAHARSTHVPTTVIRHGLDVADFPFGDGAGGHLLFLGRMAPEKGVHFAVEVAERSGLPLVIAAKARERQEREYLDEVIRPHLSDTIRFVEEPPTELKLELLADAVALVNPIVWPEPFGLVMAEALACGTPVVAFPSGSAPELVRDGVTGFLCDSVEEMCERVLDATALDRAACRRFAAEHLSTSVMTQAYLDVYGRAIARRTPLRRGTAVA